MPDSRELVLSRVCSALAPLAQRAACPDWEAELARSRAAQAVTDRWAVFAQRMRALHGVALVGAEELAVWLDQGGWHRGYCDPALWPELRAAFPPRFTVETTFERSRIDDYQFGITRATAAIAETGTLVLTDADTSRRLGALAPWVHVAVLRREQIHADVQAAVGALPQDPNVIWVSGPSKTADVEGILIEGVHGPGQQVALLLEH